MQKKLLFIVAALLLVVSACQSNASEPVLTPESTEAVVAESAPSPTPAEAEAESSTSSSVAACTAASNGAEKQNFVLEGDWVKGAADPAVTIVEYSDFQCPACARYFRITKRLIEELGKDFQLNFRHYPLKQHINAELAAKSAEAAGRQRKFWEMHDLLFERQKEWTRKKNKDTEKLFLQYAASLNLNLEQFKSDLHSQAVTDSVNNDVLSGRLSGVRSTPTFFLNGQKIIDKPRDYET